MPDTVRQRLGIYFKACIAIGFIVQPALIVQHFIHLRRRKQKRENPSHNL